MKGNNTPYINILNTSRILWIFYVSFPWHVEGYYYWYMIVYTTRWCFVWFYCLMQLRFETVSNYVFCVKYQNPGLNSTLFI